MQGDSRLETYSRRKRWRAEFAARLQHPASRRLPFIQEDYVGGEPGKINLYVGKTPIKFNIPEAEAVDRLVDLIREHGKWVEPELRDPLIH